MAAAAGGGRHAAQRARPPQSSPDLQMDSAQCSVFRSCSFRRRRPSMPTYLTAAPAIYAPISGCSSAHHPSSARPPAPHA